MGKGKKQTAVWTVFLQGTALALGVYLAGQLLLALLLVKAALPERSAFAAVAVVCVLASLAGGLRCVKGSPWGRLPSGALGGGLFAVVLVVIGLLCWEEGIAWTGQGGVLLLCALGGGVLSGLLGRKAGKRVKKKARRK